MAPPRTHVIGAGLAGLSAALHLAAAGRGVTLYEAGPQAGGRCRSYFDETLGCRIDNGNHLLLSGNRAALGYLALIGAADSLDGPAEARFPFFDRATGERWTVAPNAGPLPFWIFDRSRRVAGSRAGDYLAGGLRLACARPETTVAELFAREPLLFRRFWEPLAVAALNTEAASGAAALLRPVLRETFGRGAAACRPLVARHGLSESFVEPALAWLARHGGRLLTGSRVRAIAFAEGRAAALELAGQRIELGSDDTVVLAVPPAVAAGLLPGLAVPTEFRPIVNAHFRLAGPAAESVSLLGVIGGTADWVFRRGELASVTASAAGALIELEAEALAIRLWSDVAAALALAAAPMPPWRIVKERRATFAQTPDQLCRRPGAATRWRNLALAGDWTATGLPATIEGAIRSGEAAAGVILAVPRREHASAAARPAG